MLIFLDIDGVLLPYESYDSSKPVVDRTKFNPTCLKEFETVLRCYPQALIVISSSWRAVFSFEVIALLFSPDIAKRVVGDTPFVDLEVIEYHRHQEVIEYLRQHNAVNSHWVAVDDISENYPPDAPIVVTDSSIGFDRTAAKVLSQYLSSF
jgi:hypothetical protein